MWKWLLFLGLGLCLAVGLGAWAQTTYSIGGVGFAEDEVAAYESAVATQVNQARSLRAKAESALRFFEALDPALFSAAEKDKILQARTVIRLAAKRQIESVMSSPVTAVGVKRDLLEKAVAEEEDGAQAALDAFNAEHPE